MNRSRVALVTGASRGIGSATAKRLAADGFVVAVNYRNDEGAAEQTVAEIVEAGGAAMPFQATIGQRDDEARLVDGVLGAFGRLDVLVNNAGIASRGRFIADTDTAELERLLQVHTVGVFHLCGLVLPHLRLHDRGDIVLVSSRATSHMRAGGGAYNIAKAGMEALGRTLANEEQRNGIRVNVVAPSLVATDMGDRLARASRQVDSASDLDGSFPFGRVSRPEDVANLIAFLVGAEGDYISGQRIQVDGGGT